MSTIDLNTITSLTAQLSALQAQIAATSDPIVKGVLQAQANVVSKQIEQAAQHAQSQVDANNNILENLGLFQTLTAALSNIPQQIPSILALFKK